MLADFSEHCRWVMSESEDDQSKLSRIDPALEPLALRHVGLRLPDPGRQLGLGHPGSLPQGDQSNDEGFRVDTP